MKIPLMAGDNVRTAMHRRRGQKLAAVVIHMTDETCEQYGFQTLSMKAVLGQCFTMGVPVYFMKMTLPQGRRGNAVGGWGGNFEPPRVLMDQVKPSQRLILTNVNNNVFNESELDRHLQAERVDWLVVMGCQLRSCVRMSIRSVPGDDQGPAALDRGYKVMTARPLLLGEHDQASRAALEETMDGDIEWYESA